MEWTQDKLWELRQQIKLNSLFIADYKNAFRVDPKVACGFFDGYMEDLEDKLHPDGKTFNDLDAVFALDNPENLWSWFSGIEGDPLPITPLFFTVSYKVYGSMRIEANDQDDAIDKFETAVMNGEDVLLEHMNWPEWETVDAEEDTL